MVLHIKGKNNLFIGVYWAWATSPTPYPIGHPLVDPGPTCFLYFEVPFPSCWAPASYLEFGSLPKVGNS
jgi:hypothetical protein